MGESACGTTGREGERGRGMLCGVEDEVEHIGDVVLEDGGRGRMRVRVGEEDVGEVAALCLGGLWGGRVGRVVRAPDGVRPRLVVAAVAAPATALRQVEHNVVARVVAGGKARRALHACVVVRTVTEAVVVAAETEEG